MADDLYLVIHLGNTQNGKDAAPPLLVSRQAKGVLEDSSLSAGLKRSLIVYNGPVGWVVCDRSSEEVKTLVKEAWADLGGWKLKLVEQKQDNSGMAPSSVVESSIVNNSNFLAPYLLIQDGAHTGQPARRETLPIREGAERMLGRQRVDGRIVMDDRRVSREHLRFYVEGGAVHVENLSQYPPVLECNGETTRIAGRTKLMHKAKIRIGGSVVEFFHPMDAIPQPQAGKGRTSSTAIPTVGTEDPNAAGQGNSAATTPAAHPESPTDPLVQEGFDWVEKTLIVLAILLVCWLAFLLYQAVAK